MDNSHFSHFRHFYFIFIAELFNIYFRLCKASCHFWFRIINFVTVQKLFHCWNCNWNAWPKLKKMQSLNENLSVHFKFITTCTYLYIMFQYGCSLPFSLFLFSSIEAYKYETYIIYRCVICLNMPKYHATEYCSVKCKGYFLHKISRAWSDTGKVMWCCQVVLIWLNKLQTGGAVNKLKPETCVHNI